MVPQPVGEVGEHYKTTVNGRYSARSVYWALVTIKFIQISINGLNMVRPVKNQLMLMFLVVDPNSTLTTWPFPKIGVPLVIIHF